LRYAAFVIDGENEKNSFNNNNKSNNSENNDNNNNNNNDDDDNNNKNNIKNNDKNKIKKMMTSTLYSWLPTFISPSIGITLNTEAVPYIPKVLAFVVISHTSS
jgi:hypothetical protein